MSNTNWKVEVTKLKTDLLKELDKCKNVKGYFPLGTSIPKSPKKEKPIKPKKLKRFNGSKLFPLATYIFGRDDREYLTNTSFPYRCIGTLGGGTAALVGKNIVLTAAHVIPWQSINNGTWNLRFTALNNNGTSLLGVGHSSRVTGIAYWEQISNRVAGYDMAICRLEDNLGDKLSYFGTVRYNDDWEDEEIFTIVGYPSDMSNGRRPVIQEDVAVIDDDSDSYGTTEVETEADVSKGNSGGPLWRTYSNEPRIVGICSGAQDEYSFPWHTKTRIVFAGGNGLNRLVRWGRDYYSPSITIDDHNLAISTTLPLGCRHEIFPFHLFMSDRVNLVIP